MMQFKQVSYLENDVLGQENVLVGLDNLQNKDLVDDLDNDQADLDNDQDDLDNVLADMDYARADMDNVQADLDNVQSYEDNVPADLDNVQAYEDNDQADMDNFLEDLYNVVDKVLPSHIHL